MKVSHPELLLLIDSLLLCALCVSVVNLISLRNHFSNTAVGRIDLYHFFQLSIASNRCCSVNSSGGPKPSKLRLMKRSPLRASMTTRESGSVSAYRSVGT